MKHHKTIVWLGLVTACSVFTLQAQAARRAAVPNPGLRSSYSATLMHNAKTRGTVMSQATRERWRCSGTRCEGIQVNHLDVASCRVLANMQGPVKSFVYFDGSRRGIRQLTAAQLRQCNGGRQRTRRIVVHVGRPAPDTVRTRQLTLVGIPQAADTVRTGGLLLTGNLPAPDTIRANKLSLVGDPPATDTIHTNALNLSGGQPAADSVRTGSLLLTGKSKRLHFNSKIHHNGL